ncbi:hypothetical protein C8Q74DRAFT_46452 [Fomes fomentarius]|nr:hypothetical protein C8Q74DRAFT_46452 [Fomes fomentarius]
MYASSALSREAQGGLVDCRSLNTYFCPSAAIEAVTSHVVVPVLVHRHPPRFSDLERPAHGPGPRHWAMAVGHHSRLPRGSYPRRWQSPTARRCPGPQCRQYIPLHFENHHPRPSPFPAASLSLSWGSASAASAIVVVAPLSHFILHRRMAKPRACRQCSWRKVKCVVPEGGTRCEECIRRHTDCERPQAVTSTAPCDSCKRAHLGCEWQGDGPCIRCERTGATCTRSTPDTPPPSSESPSSPSSDRGASPPRTPFLQVVLN